MSRTASPSGSPVTARAQEAQEAVLRRGAAMSVSPQVPRFASSPLARNDRGESSWNVAPPRSAKSNRRRDNPPPDLFSDWG